MTVNREIFMRKGLFHIHTHYSFDCLTKPTDIVDKALAEGVDYLVISDHDTVEGSLAARDYAFSLSAPIEIPIAAEFCTDIGDIVTVGIAKDMPKLSCHRKLCQMVKEIGGFTILPHPYDGHHIDAIDFDLIDCIEVFNARSSPENNQKAMYLAEYHHKPYIWGCDAHFLQDITLCPFLFDGGNPYESTCSPITTAYARPLHKKFSQLVKGIKKKDVILTLRSIKRLLLR